MQALRPFSTARAGNPALFLVMLGLIAGFLNGLLGTGGGIVLVYLMQRHATRHHTLAVSPRDIYATALSVMLPISLFSATHYIKAGTLDLTAFSPMLLPSLAGGILGGILLDRLDTTWLKRLFALLVLVSGILMVIRA